MNLDDLSSNHDLYGNMNIYMYIYMYIYMNQALYIADVRIQVDSLCLNFVQNTLL